MKNSRPNSKSNYRNYKCKGIVQENESAGKENIPISFVNPNKKNMSKSKRKRLNRKSNKLEQKKEEEKNKIGVASCRQELPNTSQSKQQQQCKESNTKGAIPKVVMKPPSLPNSFENPYIKIMSKSKKKRLNRKFNKLEQKKGEKKNKTSEAFCCQELLNTSKSEQQQFKENNTKGGAIPKVMPTVSSSKKTKLNICNNISEERQQEQIPNKSPSKTNNKKEAKVEFETEPFSTKKNSAELSAKLKENSTKSKEEKSTLNKNEQNAEAKLEPELAAKRKCQRRQPRHCELLKPLIFDAPDNQLLSWLRDFKTLLNSKNKSIEPEIPFYAVGRHFGMRSTITDDNRVMNMFREFLEQRDIGYFSYTPKEHQRILLVLKRPHQVNECNPALIKGALNDLKIPVARVEDFKAMWNPDCSYNRYFIEIKAGDVNLQKLFCQTTLLGHDNWQWSKFKKPAITQCRNCQRYGHVAANCLMPYRCVKCCIQHPAGKCLRSAKNDAANTAYCHNCGKVGHPSNYRGCPAYKKRCKIVERQRLCSQLSSNFRRVLASVRQVSTNDEK